MSTYPPLNSLRIFEAAARLESFSAAAGELFVTHGAVSKQIKQLEDWLGILLFERSGGRVKLTDAGWRYLVQVQDGLDLIANATSQLLQPNNQRRLSINSTPTFASYWLLPRLGGFRARFPDLELHLATSDRDISRLDAPFDLAIRRGPGDWPGHIAKPFLKEWELPLCSPALLARIPLHSPADLTAHTLLHADTRPTAWPRWLTLAGVPELKPASSMHFDKFSLALQAATDGLGVVLGPMPMGQAQIDAGFLVSPLPEPVVTVRDYCWVVPRMAAEDPTVSAFCRWLESEAGA
ncbi:transcriptional regulator GcvA [Chromobacterium subtsugae]|uniref:Transcriptional regulator GcvA n=1 Tax=Chromobacterium subtsugae TaxID=251747 RepID=A0ABS7FD58_9NEIS|nr:MULTISPECIES: transcriptional regulator GcvA [Chromobacterium]KUM05127.1 transcriptional regulator [Chromobacterium subtsugae]KZE88146.1 transcriptional regulator [Chromobacterium sp. F49]MBW7565681.1 transcriptional regulator GcvA [Chromobacterium subtsugae]MBW8288012.1 transcriptional regulator GcvA [Chromobacterium subtsugae]OBU86853.1 transcriptional regulator [Chromobacterium subtsugae]